MTTDVTAFLVRRALDQLLKSTRHLDRERRLEALRELIREAEVELQAEREQS